MQTSMIYFADTFQRYILGKYKYLAIIYPTRTMPCVPGSSTTCLLEGHGIHNAFTPRIVQE